MFVRSILIPTILVFIIASPILFSNSNMTSRQSGTNPSVPGWPEIDQGNPSSFGNRNSAVGLDSGFGGYNGYPSSKPTDPRGMSPQTLSVPSNAGRSGDPLVSDNPANRIVPFGLASSASSVLGSPNATPTGNAFVMSQTAFSPPAGTQFMNSSSFRPDALTGPPSSLTSPMMPDTLATQTLIFPGDEFGPDLTAQP